MAKITIVQAVNQALDEEMENDKDVIVLGEDVGIDGGVFRATEGLFKKYGSDRVIDTPLSELGIVGTSIGLALYGMKPVAEIQFSGFAYAAYDQIVSHLGRLRTRSRGRYKSHVVLRTPYSGGIHSPEHHSESMEAIYVHVPGIKVVIPSTPYDTKGLLISAIRDPDPVIFMEPKKIYRAIKQDIPEEYTVPLGKCSVVQEGSDVTLVSYGAMVRVAQKAAEQSRKSCEIIDVRTLKPLDEKTIYDSVEKTGRAVIIHEGPRTCGFGAEISALINEKSLLSLKAPVLRVTGWDTSFPLYKLENYYLPQPERVVRAIRKVMEF